MLRLSLMMWLQSTAVRLFGVRVLLIVANSTANTSKGQGKNMRLAKMVPWEVMNLDTGKVMTVEACNAEYAVIEAANQTYGISQDFPLLWGKLTCSCGAMSAFYDGRRIEK